MGAGGMSGPAASGLRLSGFPCPVSAPSAVLPPLVPSTASLASLVAVDESPQAIDNIVSETTKRPCIPLGLSDTAPGEKSNQFVSVGIAVPFTTTWPFRFKSTLLLLMLMTLPVDDT